MENIAVQVVGNVRIQCEYHFDFFIALNDFLYKSRDGVFFSWSALEPFLVVFLVSSDVFLIDLFEL